MFPRRIHPVSRQMPISQSSSSILPLNTHLNILHKCANQQSLSCRSATPPSTKIHARTMHFAVRRLLWDLIRHQEQSSRTGGCPAPIKVERTASRLWLYCLCQAQLSLEGVGKYVSACDPVLLKTTLPGLKVSDVSRTAFCI